MYQPQQGYGAQPHPHPHQYQQPQFGAQVSMGAPTSNTGFGQHTGGQPDPAFAAFNMAAGASMGMMGMMAHAAANQPQPSSSSSPAGGYGGPSSPTGSAQPYGGAQPQGQGYQPSPYGAPSSSSSPYGQPGQPQGSSATVSMNMGGGVPGGMGTGMNMGMGGMPGMGMNMSVSASGSPPPQGPNGGYSSPTGQPSPSPYGAPSSSSSPYGQPQDGSASVSMNMGGMPGMPGMGMNMSVTASGSPPPQGNAYGTAPTSSPTSGPPTGGYGAPSSSSPTGQPSPSPYGQPPSSSPYGQPGQPQGGSASVSMNMGMGGGMPVMSPMGTGTGMSPMGMNMSVSAPMVPMGPQERDIIEQMFNISTQIQMNAKTNLARIRDLITQTSLPGGGVAPTSSQSIGGMPMGAAIGVSIGGMEPGMIDPKTNPKFPLNVRKNCREAEPKWLEKVAEIKNHLGRDIQLVCNWEHWYNHEKMDTHKKDNLGSTIYERYMCAWAEGFMDFSKDVDNLDAFRMALIVPIIHIKLGWDKSLVTKQKGGYIQQYFADGRLYIQVNPGYLGSGLYELSDGKYLANAL